MNLLDIFTFAFAKIPFDSKILINNLKIKNSNTNFVCKIFSRVKEF